MPGRFFMKTKLKADTGPTILLCSQISDRKSKAPSSGDFWIKTNAPEKSLTFETSNSKNEIF